MSTDLELLDRWRAGDRKAGNALFQRHFESISRFFESKVDQDVDELVQKTFFALVEHRDQFRKQASFRTYLFTIAKHQLYRHLRKRHHKKLDFGVTSMRDLQTSPTARMVRNQQKQLLVEALRTLPLEQQMLIELHYWEGMSFDALAPMFEIAPTTVRTRLFRARRALRDRMAKLADNPRPESESEVDLEAWARDLARSPVQKD